MAIKELKTRIALKYDSYSAWTTAPGKDLVLLTGELGICYISDTNPETNVVPTVLFKVGDGVKTFENLPWASAKAADVYSWAKASDVVYNETNKTITFVKGNVDGTDKVITFNYVTLDEVKSITDDLNTRLAAVENKFKGDGSVQGQIDALDGRLDVIEGEDAGSIKKAEADAKAYAKEYADSLAGKYDAAGSAAAAETAAKGYADTELSKDRTRISDLETADAAQDTLISGNAAKIKTIEQTTIPGVVSDYEAADLAINTKIGTAADGKDAATVYGAIAKATYDAVEDAASKVNTLANGQVATNKTDIAGLNTRIGNQEAKRAEEDGKLDARLNKIETFFATKKDEEGNDIALDEALDTLVEIQEYITGDGVAAKDMLDAIEANADAIKTITDITVPGVKTIAEDTKTRVGAVQTRAKTLEDIVAGYATTNDDPYKTVKAHVDAVSGRAEKGITDAAAAQSAAEAAQGTANTAVANAKIAQEEVDALELVVDGVKATADNAKTDIAALTGRVATAEGKITTAEGKITALEGIVSTGADSNANLRSAITDLQTLTDANGAIRQEIADAKKAGTDASAAVDALSKGQVATNKTDIANIQADYLKAADEFIFNCGTATTIIHRA